MKRLKVGVIGLGVGEKHIEGYLNHPDCDVVALCDFSEQKLNEIGAKYTSAKLTGKASEIFTDPEIDIISIASYDNYHYEQVIQAIDNNKHIFVEKPLCLHKSEAVEIRRMLEKKTRLKLSSNLILRMVPRFIELKQMIKEGKLGQPYYVEGDYNYGRLHKIIDGWRGKIDDYSGVYGGGVHIIDLLLWLTGDRIQEVAAYGNNIVSRGSEFRYDDTIVAILKFESGIIGKMTVNLGCVFPHFHNLSIYGTRGTFLNGMEYGTLITSRDPEKPFEKLTAPYRGIHKGSLIQSFVDSILHDSPAEVTQDDIFTAMSVCFAIVKAVHNAAPVVVEYV